MRNSKFSLIVSLLAIASLTGCNWGRGNNNNNNNNNSGGNNGDNGNGGTPSEKFHIADPDTSFVQRNSKEEVVYDDLFNLNNKVEITIDVDKSEMQKINDDNVYGGDFDNIKPETYHLAKKFTLTLHNGNKDFTWELDNVGIRQKGNTSRKPIFKDNGDIYNKNHFKISFDETFSDKAMYDDEFIAAHKNKEYKDRELLGLSGLDIKWNKVDDSTHIKEMYSNLVLRSAGIAAQKIGLGMMKMTYDGGKTADFGLCTIHEQTSKSFIKRSMGSSNSYINMPTWADENAGTHGLEGKKYGDLYKASYGKGDGASSGPDFTKDSISGKRLGVKTDIKGYNWPTYERKTNTSDEYNDQQMRDLVALLNNSATTYEQIAEKVDLEWLAMEEAVMYFLGNPDSMKYNYNNYEVYFRRTDGKMIILPIDNDRCFGVGNGWKSGADYILNKDCKPLTSKRLNNGEQKNPLLTKTIFANKANQSKTDYQACLELVKNSEWVKNETFESFYNIAKTTYNGLATFSLNGGADNISFSSYMEAKLKIYNGTSSGSIPTPDSGEGGSGSGTDDEPLFPVDTNLYLVGTFDEWATNNNYEEDDYMLRSNQNGERYCIFKVPAHSGDQDSIQLKIYGGKDPKPAWNYDYGSDGNGHIVKNSDPDNPVSKVVIDAEVGDLVKFVVNEETGAYTFTVEKENQLAFFNWSTPFKVLCSAGTDFYEADAESAGEGTYRATLNFNKSDEMTCQISILDMVEFYFYNFDNTGKLLFAGPYMNGGEYVKTSGKTSLTITVNRSSGTIAFE